MVKTKDQIRLEQQIIYNINRVVETFPEYTVAQHLFHFLRKKSDIKDPYDWDNMKLLSKIESYYSELIQDLSKVDIDNYE